MSWFPRLLSALLLAVPFGFATPIEILDLRVIEDQVQVTFNSRDDCYFILTQSDHLQAFTPVSMSRGEGDLQALSTPAGFQRTSGYFRVERIPLNEPRDSDGDGIDDLYELARTEFLDPLDGTDARQDHDTDGLSNLLELFLGTNLSEAGPPPVDPDAELSYVGHSPPHANSRGQLRLPSLTSILDGTAARGFHWDSEDGVLGVLDTGAFTDVTVTQWEVDAAGTDPPRLTFTGDTSTASPIHVEGNVIFGSYQRAVVTVTVGNKWVRYTLRSKECGGDLTNAELEVLAKDTAYRDAPVAGDPMKTPASEDADFDVTQTYEEDPAKYHYITFGFNHYVAGGGADPVTDDHLYLSGDKFKAVGMTCKERAVIAISGAPVNTDHTLGWKDGLANDDANGVGYKELTASGNENLQALLDWMEVQRGEGRSIDLTGHSGGGALVQWLAATYTSRDPVNRLRKVLTFNSPGIAKTAPQGSALGGADGFKASQVDEVMHYIAPGDLISMTGEAFIEGSWTQVDFEEPVTAFKHARPMLARHIPLRGLRPEVTELEHSGVSWLNDPFFMYYDLEWFVFLGALEIAFTNNDTLKYIPPLLIFRATAEEARKRLGSHLDNLSVTITGGGFNVTISPDGITVMLPDQTMTFFGLEITLEGLAYRYDSATMRHYFNGKATLPQIAGGVSVDFTPGMDPNAGNFILVKPEGGYDLVGKLTIPAIILVEDLWEAKDIIFCFDTVKQEYTGGGSITVPPGYAIEGVLGIRQGELNRFGFGVANLDIPIGMTGFFLQRIYGEVDHYALSDPKPVLFTGEVCFSGGPEVNVPLPAFLGGPLEAALLDFGVKGSFDRHHLSMAGRIELVKVNDRSLARADGKITWNWKDGTLDLNGKYVLLGGFVESTACIRANRKLDLYMKASSTVRVPADVPVLGGKKLGSGTGMLRYKNDLSLRNDFVAGWGEVGWFDWVVGLRVNFDGSWNRIGAKEVARLPGPALAPHHKGIGSNESFDVPAGLPELLLAASWETLSVARFELAAPDGTIYQSDSLPNPGPVSDFTDPGDQTSLVIGVSNPAAGSWTLTILGAPVGEVTFDALQEAPAPSIEVLTPAADTMDAMVTIDFEVAGVTEESTVSFFYDDNANGQDGFLIETDILVDVDGGHQFVWDTAEIPPGTYHLYAILEAPAAIPAFSDYAPGRVSVIDTAAPAPPQNVTATWSEGESLDVSWDPIASPGSYLVRYTDDLTNPDAVNGSSITDTAPDNNSVQTSILAAGVDLSLQLEGTTLASPLQSGEAVSTSITIRNSGNTASVGLVDLEFFLQRADLSEILLGTHSIEVDLAPGESTAATLADVLPALLPPGPEFTALIGRFKGFSDLEDANDEASLPVTSEQVDLRATISSTTLSTPLTDGGEGTINYSIGNGGNQAAQGDLSVSVFASEDGEHGLDDVLIAGPATITVELAPGMSMTESLEITLPDGIMDGTTRETLLVLLHDPVGFADVDPSNDVDDLALSALRVDLQAEISSSTLSTDSLVGSQVEVRVRIGNVGSDFAAGPVRIELRLSNDDTLDAADSLLVLSENHAMNLSAGDEATITIVTALGEDPSTATHLFATVTPHQFGVFPVSGGVTEFEIDGLTTGSSYAVTVIGIDADGHETQPSEVAEATVGTP